jgi:hypothetical protein
VIVLLEVAADHSQMRWTGSPWHPRDTEDAATALLYAALVADAYLPPRRASQDFKFATVAHPFRDATVGYKAVDGGGTTQAREILQAQLAECERVRADCKRLAESQ